MSGKLKNRTRRAVTYNLTTKVAPVRHLFPRRTEGKDGSVSIADKRLVLPDSITILGKGTSESLPDGVPFCPEVSAAITRREVQWIPDPVAEKSAEAAPAKTPEPAPEPAPEPESKGEPKARSRSGARSS